MWKNCPYAIFDMDGTLIDSMPYWASLGHDYLIDQGKVPEPDLRKTIAAMSMTESSRYFMEHYGVEGTVESIKKGINDKMRDNYRYIVPAKPGVRDYLEDLHRRGIKMAICSSTSADLIEAVLARLDLIHYFSVIVSCDEVGKGKGEPDAYLLTLQKLGADASECAIYEDAVFAMETARKIGCMVVGVYDDSCKKPESEVRAFCDGYIKDFRELISEDSSTIESSNCRNLRKKG